jgi:hypothetical protein
MLAVTRCIVPRFRAAIRGPGRPDQPPLKVRRSAGALAKAEARHDIADTSDAPRLMRRSTREFTP